MGCVLSCDSVSDAQSTILNRACILPRLLPSTIGTTLTTSNTVDNQNVSSICNNTKSHTSTAIKNCNCHNCYDFTVPNRYLDDYHNYRHDIVNAFSKRSTTFTKAYGSNHIIGTGSFLQTLRLQGLPDYSPDDKAILKTLGLRFFTPSEIALLHALPIADGSFSFPPETTVPQQFRLLGNSLNVRVVALILNRLLKGSQ